ncbi:hypothetical protein GLW00_07615 [Halobacillus litoralis]|uniref:Uncharacterized protein n=1 Tax=Halobacillus litoralis TaxID=45668 RepID=A0A845F8Q6_9BACI|nr:MULTISPECIES: hypothetical protein [Halobacillus]MEC3884677.1 hypothetical protein [Halobacillus sp. HZG1]MYL70712.1 hypothetical protein [Halobacillus litoralis]
MNSKNLVFMQSVAIFGYLVFISLVTVKVQGTALVTENFYFYIIFSQFVYVPVGILLALPAFLKQWGGEGQWKWKKRYGLFFLFPSLYVLLVPYVIPVDSILPNLLITNPSVSSVIQVLCGYFLVKGFEKE